MDSSITFSEASSIGPWVCPHCTYSNIDSGNDRCAICGREDEPDHRETMETTASTTETTATARTTTTTTTATEETKNYNKSCDDDDDDECHRWLSKIESSWGWDLQNAPYHIRNNKNIVMRAIKKNGKVLKFAAPELRNDKEVIMTAINNDRTGGALKYASPSLQNDKQVVMMAIQNYDGIFCSPLEFTSPELRNDKDVVMASVQKIGRALKFASPSLQNDKQVVMMAIQNYDRIFFSPLEFTSPELRNDKEVVMAAMSKDGRALKYASPPMKNDKLVVLAAVQKDSRALEFATPKLRNDKQVVISAVRKHPDAIKFVHQDLKRDPDVLTAAGMFDVDHDDAPTRQQLSTNDTASKRKVVLSTRFSLDPTSRSQATNFTALFKKSKYIQNEDNGFIVYAPNAFDKKTCDLEWTRFDHPCRGTIDTCQYTNILTAGGRPTDDCCWRYSFRSQLQEAKDTGGFVLQLVETEPTVPSGKVKDAKLGNGQKIELHMANTMGIKVFQVYRPTASAIEGLFRDHHIDVVTKEISRWYNDDNQDMSVTIIRQPMYG